MRKHRTADSSENPKDRDSDTDSVERAQLLFVQGLHLVVRLVRDASSCQYRLGRYAHSTHVKSSVKFMPLLTIVSNDMTINGVRGAITGHPTQMSHLQRLGWRSEVLPQG